MNLYLIKRTDCIGYDETDSVVVAAASEAKAREHAKGAEGDQPSSIWLSEATTVELLGTARRGVRAGIVHTSYRPG